eukprot:913419-Amphidinium_carterae.1
MELSSEMWLTTPDGVYRQRARSLHPHQGIVTLSSRIRRRLAEVFYKGEATAPSYPWFARVPSFSNPADKLSRGKIEEAAQDVQLEARWMEAPQQLL